MHAYHDGIGKGEREVIWDWWWCKRNSRNERTFWFAKLYGRLCMYFSCMEETWNIILLGIHYAWNVYWFGWLSWFSLLSTSACLPDSQGYYTVTYVSVLNGNSERYMYFTNDTFILCMILICGVFRWWRRWWIFSRWTWEAIQVIFFVQSSLLTGCWYWLWKAA